MLNASSLTKEELITNLWLTDELISEIEIIEEEIKKKNISLQATIEEAQMDYLKAVEESHNENVEYQENNADKVIVQRIKKMHKRFILTDFIISVLIGYVLIYLGMDFLHVVVFWLIVPATVYVGYRIWQSYYLNSHRPELSISPIEEVMERVKESPGFQKIPDSLFVRHLKEEIANLEQKKLASEQKLSEQTVLPVGYYQRTKEVIWYLENIESNHLIEALMALDELDYRERIQQMLEVQQNEIISLRNKIEELVRETSEVFERQKLMLEPNYDEASFRKKSN